MGRSSPAPACRRTDARRARAGSAASSGRRAAPIRAEPGWHRGGLPRGERARPRGSATSWEHLEPGFEPLQTGGDRDGDRLLEDDILRAAGVLQGLDVLVADLVRVPPHLVEVGTEHQRNLAVRLRGLAQLLDERVVSGRRPGQEGVVHHSTILPMSAPAIAGGPVLTIRGTHYPVLLPKFRDPRLHLAAVIITLQVLGQTAFGFNLSIAQILISLGTCAVLEIGIAFFRQHVIMWPASALLTGNGVAFILRVPGTPHGDWWSLHGAWIFAATAAVSLLSKHMIRWRGRHVFNPSNFGLVLCFLVLSENRAAPLDFWWGPMSIWLALAIALIVLGGLTILSRLRLLVIAGGFWLAFAGGVGVLAASGHSMTARWHLGPITGWSFWWLLVTSPEILIFLFFMITDPMTIPKGRVARVVYAVSVGLLATLLIAPQTTEYKTKVAVLGALALVCLARPLLERLLPAPGSTEDRAVPWARGLMRHGWVSPAVLALVAAGFAGLVVVAGIPARPDA